MLGLAAAATMTSPSVPDIPFVELARVSEQVAGTRSRLEKRRFFVEFLARVPAREVGAAVGWLVEEPLCGPLGVGPAHLWELSHAPSPSRASVTLGEVEDTLARAGGEGRGEVLARVAALFERLTAPERALFAGALTGTLRQGSLSGVMSLALADLSGRDETDVRRAVMVTGSIARTADALLGPDREGGPPATIELFRPLAPMLAAPAASVEEALDGIADAVVEWKVDGVRVQVHKKGGRVAVYSRQGNDITPGCAPLLGELAALDADAAVLDGELGLVGPDGVARPFQDSFSAIASSPASTTARRPGDRLRIHLFDCMHRDGDDLLDQPLSARLDALRAVAPAGLCMRQIRAGSVHEVHAFYAEALGAGHEGVMIKDRSSPYRFGGRGRAWQKVKEFATADLVVLAAEWGSGRRRGLLSNLHLGARGGDGGYCMVGKTFKGLTDATLRWQTARLEELATERAEHVVVVRPELVVEIRYGDVQRSPRYPGGIALRFARVVRYREDKPASEAESLEALVARLPEALVQPATRAPRKRGSKRRGADDPGSPQLSLFKV
jgi:DNA ligase-1